MRAVPYTSKCKGRPRKLSFVCFRVGSRLMTLSRRTQTRWSAALFASSRDIVATACSFQRSVRYRHLLRVSGRRPGSFRPCVRRLACNTRAKHARATFALCNPTCTSARASFCYDSRNLVLPRFLLRLIWLEYQVRSSYDPTCKFTAEPESFT